MTEVVAESGLVIVGPASDAGVHAHEVSSWTTFRAGSPRDPDPRGRVWTGSLSAPAGSESRYQVDRGCQDHRTEQIGQQGMV
jgi:hypothetical protein